MKLFIGLMLLTTFAHARSHTLIQCAAVDGAGLSATFIYDGFDDKYSKVTVVNKNKKLYSMSGDTSRNSCLEVDMSAGTNGDETITDIIAVFTVHEIDGCQGPFNSTRLNIAGRHGAGMMKGDLIVKHKGRFMNEEVKCSVKDVN